MVNLEKLPILGNWPPLSLISCFFRLSQNEEIRADPSYFVRQIMVILLF